MRVSITGDADQLRAELNRAQASVQKFAQSTQNIDRNTRNLNRNFRNVANQARGFAASVGAVIGAVGVGRIAQAVTELGRYQQEINLIATESRTAATDVEALQTTLRALGSSSDVRDVIVDGVDRIGEAIHIAGSEAALAADIMGRFGFSLENLEGRTGIELLTALSTELQRAQDSAFALGQGQLFRNVFETLFGDAEKFRALLDTDFVGTLRESQQILQEFGPTPQQQADLKEFNRELALTRVRFQAAFNRELAANAGNFKDALEDINALLPALTGALSVGVGILRQFVELINASSEVAPAFRSGFGTIVGLLREVGEVSKETRDTIIDPRELRTFGNDVKSATDILPAAATNLQILTEEFRRLQAIGPVELGIQDQFFALEQQRQVLAEIAQLEQTIGDPVRRARAIAEVEARAEGFREIQQGLSTIASLETQIAAAREAQQFEEVVALTRQRDALQAIVEVQKQNVTQIIAANAQLAEQRALYAELARVQIPQTSTDFFLNQRSSQQQQIEALAQQAQLLMTVSEADRARLSVAFEVSSQIRNQERSLQNQIVLAREEAALAEQLQIGTAESRQRLQEQVRLREQELEIFRQQAEVYQEDIVPGLVEQRIALQDYIDELERMREVSSEVTDALTTFTSQALTDFDNLGDAARELGASILKSLQDAFVAEPLEEIISGFAQQIGGFISGDNNIDLQAIIAGDTGTTDQLLVDTQQRLIDVTVQNSNQTIAKLEEIRAAIEALAAAQAQAGTGGTTIIANTEVSESQYAGIIQAAANVARSGVSRSIGANAALAIDFVRGIANRQILGAGGP